MKPFVVVCVLLFCVRATNAADPSSKGPLRHDVTIDFLYEACAAKGETARGDIPYFDCESYVYGVLDSYIAVRNALPKKERACFPADIAPWQVIEYARYLVVGNSRPAKAGPALIDILKRKYPCS
jgi:hypothetical protein